MELFPIPESLWGSLSHKFKKAPVPEERPWLCQMLPGYHLDLTLLLLFSKNLTLKAESGTLPWSHCH